MFSWKKWIQVWIWQFLAKKVWQNIFWQNLFGTKEKIGILFCQKLKIGTTSKLAKTRKLHFWATCFDLLTFWTPSAHTKYKHYSWLRGVLVGIWLKATRKSVTNILFVFFSIIKTSASPPLQGWGGPLDIRKSTQKVALHDERPIAKNISCDVRC